MTFEVNFPLLKKIIWIFLIFFSLKNSNVKAHFFYWHFLITSLLLKWCPIFDSLQLHQSSKFNNFLWVCWFLGKNLSNFVLPLENSTTRITIILKQMKTWRWMKLLPRKKILLKLRTWMPQFGSALFPA